MGYKKAVRKWFYLADEDVSHLKRTVEASGLNEAAVASVLMASALKAVAKNNYQLFLLEMTGKKPSPSRLELNERSTPKRK